MIKNYKELKFWQTSFQTATLVIKLTKKFPHNSEAYVIKGQIIRSTCSIGANIAEGFGRYKGKEYLRYIRVSLGSANETEFWLLLSKEFYPNLSDDINNILSTNQETIAMLVATMKKLENNHK